MHPFFSYEIWHITVSRECLQPSDLVDLDLEDMFQYCKARLPPSMGLHDSADFASTLLLPAASKGHKFSQYYVGRCHDTGTTPCRHNSQVCQLI